MDTQPTGDDRGLGWADVEACTLPTAQRPLRVAQLDDLFTTHLRSIEHPRDNAVRMVLVGDTALAQRTQALADAESSCCTFFTFTVSPLDDGQVALDIRVPAAYADVLAALTRRAEAASGGAA
jgi:cell wall-associated NlpC family hydrolase